MRKNKKDNMPRRKCTSEAQKKAIRRNYAIRAAREKAGQATVPQAGVNDRSDQATESEFPSVFPFWARLKISKNRTTLVIDEDKALDKKTGKLVDGFVHREATSEYHKGFEEVSPNPDKDKRPAVMYLKSPRKLPKHLFKPHNKQLEMPEDLRKRYDKNNKFDEDN